MISKDMWKRYVDIGSWDLNQYQKGSIKLNSEDI